MDLDDLHVFRSVVREGGVARAARRLHRVPSNVTTRVKHLEARLGVALFRRQGRGLVLTPAGDTLLGHADRLLRMADLAEQEVRGGAMRGPLRLGALESTAAARLPPLLSAYHARHAEVRIELCTGTTDALLERLRRHELDAAFVSEPFERGRFSSVPAFEEELVLITALGHRPIGDAGDLGARPVVAFPVGCSYRRRLSEWLAEGGIALGPVLDLASYHAIVACVAAGTGVAIMPAQMLDHAVLGRSVMRHALPERVRRNRTHLVWPGAAAAPVEALLGLLRESVPR
jgi:DNA-binding transcriptional LysR family regulator